MKEATDSMANSENSENIGCMAKIFCTQELQEIVKNSMALLGGDAYAGPINQLDRLYRDSASLMLAGTANDVLISKVGANAITPR